MEPFRPFGEDSAIGYYEVPADVVEDAAQLAPWMRKGHRRCSQGETREKETIEISDKLEAMNTINLIVPYRYEGMWVFDDPRVGLDKEPFVSGADRLIDMLVADIPNAQKGFRLLFSATPFPGYKVKLEWKREEYGGNWYFSPEFKMEGWLCPALFKYFDSAPKEIYVKAEAIHTPASQP